MTTDSLELLFRLRVEGQKTLDDVKSGLSGVQSATKLTNNELGLFDSAMKTVISSGSTVKSALTEISKSQKELGSSIAGTAREILNQIQAETAAVVSTNNLAAATTRLGQAHSHAVSQISATSGAIRVFEGNMPIRAVENFLAKTLGLGPAIAAAFPLIGGIAFAELLVHVGKKVHELYQEWDLVAAAEKRAKEAAKEYGNTVEGIKNKRQSAENEIFGLRNGQPALLGRESDQLAQEARQKQIIADGQTAIIKRLEADLAKFRDQRRHSLSGSAISNQGENGDERIAAAKADLNNAKVLRLEFQEDADQTRLRSTAKAIEAQKALKEQDEKNARAEVKAERPYEQAKRQVEALEERAAEKQLSGLAKIIQQRDHELDQLRQYPDLLERASAAYDKFYGVEYKAEVAKGNALGRDLKERDEKFRQGLDVTTDQAFSESSRLAQQFGNHNASAFRDELKFGNIGGVTTPLGRATRADISAIPRQATSQDLLRQVQGDARQQERLLQVSARPGEEFAAQQKISDLRISTANKVLELELNIANTKHTQGERDQAAEDARLKAAQTIKDVHEQDALRVAEIRRQNDQESRGLGAGLTGAALSGNVGGFFRQQGTQLLTQVGGNISGGFIDQGLNAVRNVIPNTGFLRNALGGTLLDKDKGIDGNTKATHDNTDAINRQNDLLSGRTLGGPSGSSGLSGILGQYLGNVIPGAGTGSFGSIFSGQDSNNPFVFHGFDSNSSSVSGTAGKTPSYSGVSGFSSGLSHTGDLQGIFTGVSSNRNGAESLSTSERLGGAVGTAGVVASGTFAAIDGFKKGGAKGYLAGSSAILGTAAALDPEPISKAVLGAAALVTGIVTQLLGDPKQIYEEKVSKTLQENQYIAPTSITRSMGLNGMYADVDAQGNARSSNLSSMPQIAEGYYDYMNGTAVPGTQLSQFGGGSASPQQINVNVQTLDSRSFSDNSGMIADAVRHAVSTGPHPLIDELRSQLQPGAY